MYPRISFPSPFPDILHKNREASLCQLPSTSDLEFYEYSLSFSIMQCQCKFFLDGVFIERSTHPPRKLVQSIFQPRLLNQNIHFLLTYFSFLQSP